MSKIFPLFLLGFLVGCGHQQKELPENFLDVGEVDVKETDDANMYVGHFAAIHLNSGGEKKVLLDRVFSHTVPRVHIEGAPETGKVQVDIARNRLKLDVGDASWSIEPDFKLSEFKLLKKPVVMDNMNVVARKQSGDSTELIIVNYFLSNRESLLDVHRLLD